MRAAPGSKERLGLARQLLASDHARGVLPARRADGELLVLAAEAGDYSLAQWEMARAPPAEDVVHRAVQDTRVCKRTIHSRPRKNGTLTARYRVSRLGSCLRLIPSLVLFGQAF